MFKCKDYVLTIYKTGSFTKASEILFVSQPSLSATIKRLEEKIGLPLFDRSKTPITLTETGEQYVKIAESIGELESGFSQYLSDRVNLIKGKITIGGSSFFSSFILPELVSSFNSMYPGIKFEIIEDSTKNLINGVLDGRIDILMDNAILENENIISTPFTQERLILAVPKNDRINKEIKNLSLTKEDIILNKHLSAEPIDLRIVKKQPFILLRQENDTGKRAEKLFKKNGVNPNVLFYIDQQITAFNMASTGIGLTFLSDTLIKKARGDAEICYYAIGDLIARRNIYFYQKKNKYLSLACKKFIELNRC